MAFDLEQHLHRQRKFSMETFGPGMRTLGVTDHIQKELDEIRAKPNDLEEWIDVVILALDGAHRTGAEPKEIVEALVAKQTKNEARNWPDWRNSDPNKAITHLAIPETNHIALPEPYYYGAWGTYEDIFLDAPQLKGKFDEDEVLFAGYYTPSYEGSAFILINHGGELYEWHGSHCSCYGLEECGDELEETSPESLVNRDYVFGYEQTEDKEVFKELLKRLANEQNNKDNQDN